MTSMTAKQVKWVLRKQSLSRRNKLGVGVCFLLPQDIHDVVEVRDSVWFQSLMSDSIYLKMERR